MLLEFDAPVVAPVEGLVIGSRLDTDPNSPTCRLAFHGTVKRIYASPEEYRSTLSVSFCVSIFCPLVETNLEAVFS